MCGSLCFCFFILGLSFVRLAALRLQTAPTGAAIALLSSTTQPMMLKPERLADYLCLRCTLAEATDGHNVMSRGQDVDIPRNV